MSAALPIGAIAARLVGSRKQKGDADNPTDPVRAYSWDVEDQRAKPNRPIGDGSPGQGWAFRNALLEAFKDLHFKHETEGYDGPHKVQATFLLAFEKLLQGLDHKTGELFDSYDCIAGKSGKGRGTAIRMVECAEYHGFLCHVRRSRKVDGAEGQARPQRAQASNAYFFDCERRMKPERFAVFWRKLMANLKRLSGAAVRAAHFLKRAFNSVAQPAPRTQCKELTATLRSLELAVEGRAQALSVSP